MPRKSARITWLTTTLAGSPVVGRNIWYDYGDVALIVDWAEASSAHNYTISFNLPGTASTVGGVLSDGSIQTQHSSGNVKVAPLLRTGQTAARGPLPITTAPTATFGFATPGGEGDGWLISTVDSAGDVGRFTSIQLDPNYPKSSDVVIAYENTSSGSFKYAAQFRGGWKTLTIDDDTTMGGGYISLQFQSKREADGRYQPTVSYYDAGNTALKFARFDGAAWQPQTLVSEGNVGLYTGHVYDAAARANVFYYNRSSNRAYRTTLTPGGWVHRLLGAGGREINVARNAGGVLAYSTLDERGPLLEVNVLPS